MKKYWSCLLIFVIVLTLAWSSGAAASPTFTSIDFPGAACTIATGINRYQQIVGFYATAPGSNCGLFVGSDTHGFILDHGNFSTLDFPGSASTRLYGINDSGQIVGVYSPASRSGGFLFDHGSFTTIYFPVNPADPETKQNYDFYTSVIPLGINNPGQIVGVYRGLSFNAFFLDHGVWSTINFPQGGYTQAFGINDAGQVVGDNTTAGSYGFLLDDGVWSTITATHGSAYDINNNGQIVGIDANGGFLLDNGSYTVINFPGAISTRLMGINDLGDIVGSADNHGFIFTNGIPTPPAPPTPPGPKGKKKGRR